MTFWQEMDRYTNFCLHIFHGLPGWNAIRKAWNRDVDLLMKKPSQWGPAFIHGLLSAVKSVLKLQCDS